MNCVLFDRKNSLPEFVNKGRRYEEKRTIVSHSVMPDITFDGSDFFTVPEFGIRL
jgi:hypothetical protein